MSFVCFDVIRCTHEGIRAAAGVDLLSNSTNSANELPIDVLGRIYVRYPDQTLRIVALSDRKEELLKLLEYGVDENCYLLKQKIRDYE